MRTKDRSYALGDADKRFSDPNVLATITQRDDVREDYDGPVTRWGSCLDPEVKTLA